MSARVVVASLSSMLTLASFAFSPHSAAGATLYTCVPNVPPQGVGFSKSHCTKADAVGTGASFKHVSVPEGTTTGITGTTVNTAGESTSSTLHSVQSGVEVEFEAKHAHILPEFGGILSWGRNSRIGSLHFYWGFGWLRYTSVTVKKPAGKGCSVKGGEVTTNKLEFTNESLGEEVLIRPAEGTVLAQFEVEGCTIAALNGVYKVEGSIKAQTDGATVRTIRLNSTEQGTLKLRGQKAGLESAFTVEGYGVGDIEDHPLSATSVTT